MRRSSFASSSVTRRSSFASNCAQRCSTLASNRAKLSSFSSLKSDRYVASTKLNHSTSSFATSSPSFSCRSNCLVPDFGSPQLRTEATCYASFWAGQVGTALVEPAGQFGGDRHDSLLECPAPRNYTLG